MTFQNPRLFKYSIALILSITVVFYGSIFFLESHFGLRVGLNASSSLPDTFYLTSIGVEPKKGEKALFHPPRNKFYPEEMEFMKIVAGVGGDIIKINENKLFINDVDLGVIKHLSSSGDELFPIEEGVIPTGYFFMWTPHVNSYDSRYKSIGLIHEDSVIGVSRSVF